jgi:integrase
MSKILKIISKVHGKVHDLRIKKQYSGPYIYTGGVDITQWNKIKKDEREAALKKPWYIYWSFRNPETGKLQRQDNIKGGANEFSTKKERMEVLKYHQKNLSIILSKGFDPYKQPKYLSDIMSVEEAFAFALNLQQKTTAPNSYLRFKSRIKRFEKHLNFQNRFITSIEKRHVMQYLNEVLEKTSPRNRNNTRTDINTLFQILEDNDIIPLNFVKSIKQLKAPPRRNKTYTSKMVEDLKEYMAKENPSLLLFIEFVSFNFLRPVEVCRLRVGDINLKEKTLVVQAKNQLIKQKIIPQMLIDKLPDLSEFDKSAYLFGANGGPGQWDATEDNRRDNFSKQFKVVKDHFGLGDEYGIYSFRHYEITRLYRTFRKELTPYEVKSRLMLITGHSTMAALEKYLRDLDAEIPDDYSKYL